MRAGRAAAIGGAILLGFCAALAAAYFVLLPLLFPRPGISSQLAVIDSAIAGGYFSTAQAELLAIRTLRRNESDALRVLKRAFTLSRQAGDFRVLAIMADRALASGALTPSVRSVATYAYLRTGRLADAEATARGGLPAGVGDLLRGEVSLKRGTAWLGSDSLTRGLLTLETSRQPSDFLAAAKSVDDKRINLDAALLFLENGDLGRAHSLAAASLADAAFDLPAALIAYDFGDFKNAIQRLTRLQGRGSPRADYALLLSDCYRALGMNVEYDGALRDALRLDPRISWTPYADLAVVAQAKGDIPSARSFLAEGRAIFPASRELALALARLYVATGDTPAALGLLDALVVQGPDDAEAALLLLSLRSPSMTAQAYLVELWKLFDRLTSDPRVFLRLESALIALHDWDGAGLAVHEHEIAQGGLDADALSIRAVIQEIQGEEQQAAESFELAVADGGNGKSRYNLAVHLLHQGNAQEALAQLDEAGLTDNRTAARIETLRGRCLLATGNLTGAHSAFLRAQSIDPHDMRAGLELRKLEARRDQ
jgi:tetratricopeptide (TPR) repeat protein